MSVLVDLGPDAIEQYRPKISNPENSKLGPDIHAWSITAGSTCPGATAACLSVCYAMRGRLAMQPAAGLYVRNWLFSQTDEFVGWMKAALRLQCVRTLRLHTSGDFYDAEYVGKWIEIAKSCPRVQLFGYTRSWRLDDMRPALKELSRLANFELWLSEDVNTGASPRWKSARVAWMARNDAEAELAPPRVDLVFRDNPKTLMKKTPIGLQVCPNEQHIVGKPRIDCSHCKICFTQEKT